MPLMIGMAAILSLLLIPRFEAPLRSIDPEARKWILAGGILIGIQSTIFTTKEGSRTWEFDIEGIFDTTDPKGGTAFHISLPIDRDEPETNG